MNKQMKLGVILMALLSLAGCQEWGSTETGSVAGALVGAAVGSHVGRGQGRIVATVGGAMAGMIIGSRIGAHMDAADKRHINEALESSKTNQESRWSNPESGNMYTVRPTRTYYRADRPCREYVVTARIGREYKNIHGKACRDAKGRWQVAK